MQGEIFHPQCSGLGRERIHLDEVGLPENFITTIHARMLERLLPGHYMIPNGMCLRTGVSGYVMCGMSFQCSVPIILSFLQDLVDQGKAFYTVKFCIVATAVCCLGFDGKAVGQHPLVSLFYEYSPSATGQLVPSWDLSTVLICCLTHPLSL